MTLLGIVSEIIDKLAYAVSLEKCSSENMLMVYTHVEHRKPQIWNPNLEFVPNQFTHVLKFVDGVSLACAKTLKATPWECQGRARSGGNMKTSAVPTPLMKIENWEKEP